MAVRFNFTLNDQDAETLLDVLQSEKRRILELEISERIGENPDKIRC